MEADEMRKIKLSKSDSKIKIAWASSTKDNGDDKS